MLATSAVAMVSTGAGFLLLLLFVLLLMCQKSLLWLKSDVTIIPNDVDAFTANNVPEYTS
jgi:hypothetical protein